MSRGHCTVDESVPILKRGTTVTDLGGKIHTIDVLLRPKAYCSRGNRKNYFATVVDGKEGQWCYTTDDPETTFDRWVQFELHLLNIPYESAGDVSRGVEQAKEQGFN